MGNVTDNDSKIKSAIMAGSRACLANVRMLRSKILTTASKIQIYRTLMGTNVCVKWAVTENCRQILKTFKRKILLMIFEQFMEIKT